MMASLLTDPLFQISGRGTANRDFYHFVVTKSDVIWRWWKISMRAVHRFSQPVEVKEPHLIFLEDTSLQYEVSMIFGRHILLYTKDLCQGHYDYLERLSYFLLLQIINYLPLEDVIQLGRTSCKFKQLCWSEEYWERAMRQRCSTVSDEMASLALEMGWRNIFFTNKLQLQKLISRRKPKTEDKQEGQVSDEDTKAEASPSKSPGSDQTSSPVGESQPGIIPIPTLPSLGTVTAPGFDASSSNDVDPGSNPEAESGSDSSCYVSSQSLEDKSGTETEVQNTAFN